MWIANEELIRDARVGFIFQGHGPRSSRHSKNKKPSGRRLEDSKPDKPLDARLFDTTKSILAAL